MKLSRDQVNVIIKNGQSKGLSGKDVLDGLISRGYEPEGIDLTQAKKEVAPVAPVTAPNAEPKQNRIMDTAGDIGGIFTDTAESSKKRADNINEIQTALRNGDQGMLKSKLQMFGQLAGAGADAIGNVGKGVLKIFASPETEQKASEILTQFGKKVAERPEIKGMLNWYDGLDPDEKRSIDALGGVVALASEFVGGGGVATKVGQVTAKSAKMAKNAIVNTIDKTAKDITTGIDDVVESPLVQGGANFIKRVQEEASRVPSRIKTNLDEKQALESAIKSLPSQKAQNAVRDGVDITDVQELSSIQRTAQSNKLIQTVKDFANRKTKTDPIEVVGEPIIKRVQELNKTAEDVGKKLGDVAKNIGIVTRPELTEGVYNALKEVPSLQGLKITERGTLDFSGTTLADALRKTDKVAIQKAFNEATRWGDGLKAHNFRKSLFEILGGKKRSLTNLTDTEETAFNAIRKGLSDVLESKSGSYKTLSNEYRKIVQPLAELRKLMKNIDPNSSEDILNMSAGLLARRITSAGASNPQIRQLLQALDDAGVKGNVKGEITQLQDLYNILNKYYDIAPKTGFQNLSKQAGSDSLMGTLKAKAKDIGGNSNAVRQKALEALLEELGTVLK